MDYDPGPDRDRDDVLHLSAAVLVGSGSPGPDAGVDHEGAGTTAPVVG